MGGESREHESDDDAEPTGSQRRCIVTRAERSPNDLIRFVVDPQGAVVPDVARKLPGRGVWVLTTVAGVKSSRL